MHTQNDNKKNENPDLKSFADLSMLKMYSYSVCI